jgi:type IV secretion system protein TrbL
VTTSLLAPDVLPTGIDIPNPFEDIPNPFSVLAVTATEAAGSVATSLWTAAMLAIWNAGLFFFRLILNLMDAWLTPDLSTDGPAGSVYAYCFWLAGSLMVMFLVGQLGLAAFRRDARLLGRAAIGSGQFVLVWSSWIGYCVALIAACGGLTRALLGALFGGQSLSQIDLWRDFSTDSVTSAVTATVLGFLGIFLILASLAHLLVFLVRSASLIVLVATSQISAAGLVAEFGRSWFFKTVRWVHAAAFAPVLMVLVLGLGAKMTEGVATGLTDTTQQAIGSAVPGVVLICMSAVCPFALFKLLAFVDPGTATGAAMRQGLAAQGGIQGLLSGQGATWAATGSSAASSTDEHGTSSGEDAAESATGGRFASAMKSALGPIGTGVGMASSFGAKAVAISTDLNNQAGVGDHNQYPDFTSAGSGRKRNNSPSGGNSGQDGSTPPEDQQPVDQQPEDISRGPDDDTGGAPVMPNGPAPKGPTPPPGGAGGNAAGGAGGGGAGGGGAAAGAAAEIPPVAV